MGTKFPIKLMSELYIFYNLPLVVLELTDKSTEHQTDTAHNLPSVDDLNMIFKPVLLIIFS